MIPPLKAFLFVCFFLFKECSSFASRSDLVLHKQELPQNVLNITSNVTVYIPKNDIKLKNINTYCRLTGI